MDESFDYQGWLASRPTLAEDRSHPNHWHNRAADLHASAGALWHAMGSQDVAIASELGYAPGFRMGVACWPVYHMLCGLSLELIMKAVLAQRGLSPAQFKGHSFKKLHQLLDCPMDATRTRLMAFYEASLLWAGRYPTPLDATDDKLLGYYALANEILTKPIQMGEPGVLNFKISSGATDWNQYTDLWREYSDLFQR